MDLDQMAYRCPQAEMVETVRLEGYRLTFAAAGSGLATIFPEEGSHVDGVLWSLTVDFFDLHRIFFYAAVNRAVDRSISRMHFLAVRRLYKRMAGQFLRHGI